MLYEPTEISMVMPANSYIIIKKYICITTNYYQRNIIYICMYVGMGAYVDMYT